MMSMVQFLPQQLQIMIDPYLISPTLILVISQRLARTLCKDSKKPVPLRGELKENMEKEIAKMPSQTKEKIQLPKEIYQAFPSATCPRGTRGRTGVFEVFEINKDMEELIAKSPTIQELEKEARKQGMLTLKEDGILKVLESKIGIEELEDIVAL